jgi:hypothetical protein
MPDSEEEKRWDTAAAHWLAMEQEAGRQTA